MNYFGRNIKYQFKRNNYSLEKEEAFLYELALKRGQNRGWYPKDWTIEDYEQHLFRRDLFNV